MCIIANVHFVFPLFRSLLECPIVVNIMYNGLLYTLPFSQERSSRFSWLLHFAWTTDFLFLLLNNREHLFLFCWCVCAAHIFFSRSALLTVGVHTYTSSATTKIKLSMSIWYACTAFGSALSWIFPPCLILYLVGWSIPPLVAIMLVGLERERKKEEIYEFLPVKIISCKVAWSQVHYE